MRGHRDLPVDGGAFGGRLASALAAVAVLLMVVGWWTWSAKPTAAPPSEPLVVAAASDLGVAFPVIGAEFKRQTGIAVTFSFGASGSLAAQVANAAPIDVFAAANASFVDGLIAKDRLRAESRQPYARGVLALWGRNDSPFKGETIEDLADDAVGKIALANPSLAPYGLAAKQTLQSLGLWERLQDKLVFSEGAREALQFAESGAVDAAFVPVPLIYGRPTAGRWFPIAAELHEPLEQVMAVTRDSAQPEAATKFVAFVSGPEGRRILAAHGFGPPAGAR